jgi:hypothetical protein
MKPTYIRRIRRKPAASKDNPVFRKEGQKENSFFGETAQASFFQPAQAVQRKCEKCEDEDKQVKRHPDKKEETNTHAAEGANDTTANYLNNLHGKGTALPAHAQEFFGERMGQDFSGVKIHTGTEAAQSAAAINAQAYTYENHIVFNEGKYNTQSAEGKHLLAHELTHVVQQGNGAQGSESVQRKDAKSAQPKQAVVDCDRAVIAAVRQEAHIKAQQAMFKLKGNHPTLGERQQREAYYLARRIISRTLSLEQATDIVEKMVNALSSNEKVECGPEIDACSSWNAYVVGNRPPMHTCNKFFQLGHDDQVKTILHEAAHAVGIGNPSIERYIFGFDCDSPELGTFDTADSWAYFVLCASNTQ